MSLTTRRILFLLFFLSGFSSLVYQVVWTRLAFASFGIITPVLSVVLSVFMLGLAIGSWAGGRWIGALTARSGVSAAFFYGGAELVIGLGALAVPRLFSLGERLLLAGGGTDSFGYLLYSALVLAASLLPWCVCMGATFPFMMAYIRARNRVPEASFSFLYLANVLGAMLGTLSAALVWIELLGFRHTLWLAAAGNFAIALISFGLGCQSRSPSASAAPVAADGGQLAEAPNPSAERFIKWILFSTGFIAMAMEVVWTRAFTPVLKTQVYSFAMIVFTYLGATFVGSRLYREDRQANRVKTKKTLITALAFASFLPVILNTPKIVVANHVAAFPDWFSVIILLAGITPFCALLGYLTPGLIDEYSGGNPARAGAVYALNVVGCILGPLVAGYLLLPYLSERLALVLLSLPLLAFCFQLRRQYSIPQRGWLCAGLGLAVFYSAFGVEDFTARLRQLNPQAISVRRDHVATVTAYGEGFHRSLLVNGIGMTILTPITKFMVHLPLACHKTPPQSALVICFGMGTSYRSALSWNIDTTVVELVPSVPRQFGFFHADAGRLANDPNGHIVIDDGRRFLRRTAEKFDVIVVDPPPPIEAAGSSLLFSKEFYDVAKPHLKPGGILQMWFPGNPNLDSCQAAMRSIHESFPYLRCYQSIAGVGTHMLASMEPIETLDGAALVARMPESARRDLLEWDPRDAAGYLDLVLNHEYEVAKCLNPDVSVQVTDDAPYNEYYWLRQWEQNRRSLKR